MRTEQQQKKRRKIYTQILLLYNIHYSKLGQIHSQLLRIIEPKWHSTARIQQYTQLQCKWNAFYSLSSQPRPSHSSIAFIGLSKLYDFRTHCHIIVIRYLESPSLCGIQWTQPFHCIICKVVITCFSRSLVNHFRPLHFDIEIARRRHLLNMNGLVNHFFHCFQCVCVCVRRCLPFLVSMPVKYNWNCLCATNCAKAARMRVHQPTPTHE